MPKIFTSNDCTLLKCRTAAFALSLSATAHSAFQTFVRQPKTDVASGDRPMLFSEFYVFFQSRLVQ
ncbi:MULTISPECIES: hypothetical protein [unclassified Nodularia (in: cyanobacteria)]|uniref:hypothetical protein n=1 Tax=unclassified Nodularia (in: cyanobacteria) TaxID=2656917 RepID=UPI001D128F34|nr:hypothetical protein [Nodularia sp. LEGE 04288]MCC2692191.1 hypothetical protein [Nodularia sp. LEGE 04288]